MAKPKKDLGDVPQFKVHTFRKTILKLLVFYILFLLISNYGLDGLKNIEINELMESVSSQYLDNNSNDSNDSSEDTNVVKGPVNGNAIFTFVDVGQGDSTLIQFDGYDILVDAGEKAYGDDVVNALKKANVDDLEFLVATHPHSDHIGGISEVLESFEVENFVMPDVEHTTATYEKMLDIIIEKEINVIIPSQGEDLIDIDGVKVKVISPEVKDDDNLNNYSICLRVDYGNTRLILTGDAEAKIEEMILDSGIDINADIYQVGHHGSVTSNTETFLEAMQPQIAIISAGKNNDYGHPHDEVVDRIQSFGTKIYNTIDTSTITITTDGDEIKVDY